MAEIKPLKYMSGTPIELHYTGETRPEIKEMAEIEFQVGSIRKVKTANFHAYNWDADVFNYQLGAEVLRWTKAPIVYEMEIHVRGSVEDRKDWLEYFHYITDRDIQKNTPGRFYWDEMYIECFIASTSTFPDERDPMLTINTVTVYCPYPFWQYEKIGVTSELASTTDEQILMILDAPMNVIGSIERVGSADLQLSSPFPYLQCNYQVVLPAQATINAQFTYEVRASFDNVPPDSGWIAVDSRWNKKEATLRQDIWDHVIGNSAYKYRTYPLFMPIEASDVSPDLKNVSLRYSLGRSSILRVFFERSEPIWI